MGILEGWAFSYERGTSVGDSEARLSSWQLWVKSFPVLQASGGMWRWLSELENGM
jgi:hypothetical protein